MLFYTHNLEIELLKSCLRDRDNYHMCDTILVQYLPTNAYTMMCATWLMMVATIQNPLWHAHGDADADIPNIALINATFVCTIGHPLMVKLLAINYMYRVSNNNYCHFLFFPFLSFS